MPYQKTSSRNIDEAHSRAQSRPQDAKLATKCSIRPKRVGFVVEAGDEDSIRTVIRINSALWGGVLNPIIPVYKKRPRWWTKERYLSQPSAEEIFQSYIDAFEPDEIVSVTPNILKGIAWEKGNTKIHFGGNLDDPRLYGITADRFYLSAYKDLRAFPDSLKPKLLLPKTSKEKYAALVAAMYGEFPPSWKGFESQCKEYFDVEEPVVPDEGFVFPRTISPLALSLHKITFQPKAPSVVMALNGADCDEIVDFWNLRALGWSVQAYDVRWKLDSNEFRKKFGIRTVDYHIMQSRRISDDVVQEICASIKGKGQIYCHRYPRLLNEYDRRSDSATREVASHISWTELVAKDASELSFERIRLELDLTPSSNYNAQWVATVALEGNRSEHILASTMPFGFGLSILRQPASSPHPTFSSEGLTVACRDTDRSFSLTLPKSLDCIKALYQGRKFTVDVSPAAVNAQELLKAVGDLDELNTYANQDILKMLNNLSQGKTINRVEIAKSINKAHSGKGVANRTLSKFLEHQALTMGLQITCSFCNYSDWHSLESLADFLQCRRCLRQFPFPMADPPKESAWCYRSNGCFALPGFADGAFSVCLSARFLLRNCAAKGSWFPGLTLKGSDKTSREFDLVMFWQDLDSYEPSEIIVECKTFGPFDDKDFERAEWIHRNIPEAIIVFATLRETITASEVRRIKRLCNLKRQKWRKHENSLGVLVLTGVELFSGLPPPLCWKDFAADYKFIKAQFDDVMNLSFMERLCDISQQIHLALPRYFDYIDTFNKKRRLPKRKKIV